MAFLLTWASPSLIIVQHSHLISVIKTMFLLVLDWGRATVPNLESGRFVRRWLAGHWIPDVFPSFEIHTTRPVLLHSGHSAWSPRVVMFLFPPSSCCLQTISSQISFLTCTWFALMIYIFCSFLLNPLLIYTIPFTSWLFNLKRFNYSIGSAQRIRETLHLDVCFHTNKRIHRKHFREQIKSRSVR